MSSRMTPNIVPSEINFNAPNVDEVFSKDWAGIEARGRQMQLPVACVFDFEDDRLINESVYFDFATLQRQLTA